jgi:hypothetical protein
MRTRGLISAALVLMVLAMSAGAPACDLFCSFERLHFLGHEAGCEAHCADSSAGNAIQAVAAAATMEGMDMDHMSVPVDTQQIALPTDSPVATLHSMAGCVHEPCSQTAISVSAKSTVHCPPLTVARTLASSATSFAPRFSRIRIRQFDATPPNLGPLDPLGTTLRV